MLLCCNFFIKCLEELIGTSITSGDYIDGNFKYSFIFFNILLQNIICLLFSEALVVFT